MFDSMGSYGEGPDCGCSISIPDVITVIVKTKEQLEEERLAKERKQEQIQEQIDEAMRKLDARVALGKKIAKEKGNTVCCKRCYYAETHPFTGKPSCDFHYYVGDEVSDAYAKEKGVYIPYVDYTEYRLLNVDRDCRYFRQTNIIKRLFKEVKIVFNLE